MQHLIETVQDDLTYRDKQDIYEVMEKWHTYKGWTETEARLASNLTGVMVRQGEVLDRQILKFTSLINAFSKAPNLYREAENILDFMESFSETHPELRPDRVAINTVIGALAKSKERGTARAAERLLVSLEEDYERTADPLRKPYSRSYGKVIDAYAREGLPDS